MALTETQSNALLDLYIFFQVALLMGATEDIARWRNPNITRTTEPADYEELVSIGLAEKREFYLRDYAHLTNGFEAIAVRLAFRDSDSITVYRITQAGIETYEAG